VQIETQIFPDGCAAAYKHPSVLWVLFDDPSIEDGFNDVLTLKTFLQGMSHRVASDKIVSSPHSFTDDFDVYSFHCIIQWEGQSLPRQPVS
jgi:hypothetical protein